MKIEVTPIQGTANQFTVTLAGTYRLAFSGAQEEAKQAANFLRKQINRSGRKTVTEVRVGNNPTNVVDAFSKN